MRVRSFLCRFLILALLANSAGWAGAAFAASAEHERESILLGQDEGNASGSPHSTHGCAGHFQHHAQGPVSPAPVLSIDGVDAAQAVLIAIPPPQQYPSAPFRPPSPSQL